MKSLHKIKYKSRGFTLVETIIYIAIIGFVATSFIYFGVAISDYRAKAYVVQEAQTNLRMALDVISKKIRSANDVNIEQSIFDADPGVLSLSMDDVDKNPTVISLDQDDGILQITEGTSSPVAIISNEVKVSNLVFKNLTSTSSIENIGAEITLDYNNYGQDVEYNYTEDIETSVSLRR